MRIEHRTRTRRTLAVPVAALWAAFLLVLLTVAPVLADSTRLDHGHVWPRVGTTSTTIQFDVRYRNHDGKAPQHVSVVIDGTAHAMAASGSGWKTGVALHWSSKLSAGTHHIRFESLDADGTADHDDAGIVTILGSTPSPTPTPKPTPTPSPTPKPTPKPSPTPSPTPKPTPSPSPSHTPSPSPSHTPAPSHTPTPTHTPAPTSTPGHTPAPTSAPRSTPKPSPSPSPSSTAPGAGGGTGSGTGGAGGSGGTGGPDGAPGGTGDPGNPTTWPDGGSPGEPGSSWAPGMGGVGGRPGSGGGDNPSGSAGNGSGPGTGNTPDGGTSPLGAGVVGSTGGGPADGSSGGSGAGANGGGSGGPGGGSSRQLHEGWGVLAAALDLLGVRPSPTTTVLPMLVGTTTATTMAFAFAIFGKKRRDEEAPAPDEVLQAHAARGHGQVPGGEVVREVRGPAAVAPPVDTEAGMPRWRRPSVQAARKSDPSRFVESAKMSFDTGVVRAVEGRERRVIRYRVVRLLDAPDELRSTDIGQLDQGDEVQLLEKSGAYWLVLCPDGRQGWLHKMTLGEIVRDEAQQQQQQQQQSWSTDVDDDVLAAFLAAKARA